MYQAYCVHYGRYGNYGAMYHDWFWTWADAKRHQKELLKRYYKGSVEITLNEVVQDEQGNWHPVGSAIEGLKGVPA